MEQLEVHVVLAEGQLNDESVGEYLGPDGEQRVKITIGAKYRLVITNHSFKYAEVDVRLDDVVIGNWAVNSKESVMLDFDEPYTSDKRLISISYRFPATLTPTSAVKVSRSTPPRSPTSPSAALQSRSPSRGVGGVGGDLSSSLPLSPSRSSRVIETPAPVQVVIYEVFIYLEPKVSEGKLSNIDVMTDYIGVFALEDADRAAISELYQGGSIGETVEAVTSPRYPLASSKSYGSLGNLKPNQMFLVNFYQSYRSYLDALNRVALPNLRSIIVMEETVELSNQALEYLCSAGNIEELYLAGNNTITSLPLWHLKKLKHLFIAYDQNVSVTDQDLMQLPELQSLALTYNNSITNQGIESCPKLVKVVLNENLLVRPDDIRAETNPHLREVVTLT